MSKWFMHNIIFIVLSLFFSANAVLAADILHINIGRIVVDDQSIRSQQTAGKKALRQVFIKISGNENIDQTPEISRAINNYEQYLIASSFIQINTQLVFEANFSRNKVEQLLLASGQSVWTSLRPNGLLWLVNENDDDSKSMLTHVSASSLLPVVENAAFARGVDIILPLGDIQDTTEVSLYDLWNQYLSRIITQSQRYNPDFIISSTIQLYSLAEHEDRQALERAFKEKKAILEETEQTSDDETTREINPIEPEDVLSLDDAHENAVVEYVPSILSAEVPADTQFKLDYIITNEMDVKRGVIYAREREEAIVKLIDSYANILAQEFALGANFSKDKNTTLLEVNNIASLVDYLSLIELLNSVPSVSAASLRRLAGDKALIDVEHAMTVQQLSAILALDPRTNVSESAEFEIQKSNQNTQQSVLQPQLQLHWQK
ncbi:DUF2066 domain-containing protein [Glaciecola petra]|uniref:DUF2066 domain-containing protein n=1 Tax=Glaciecola petra TaxID=3075602 RepID=A0ABU2ZRS4_9ALTE|nr:DUF2066 domain-containing protein [Aestuariibacter sp. P117]MDT0594304.1 DUF2066 domain-containing protein [Aestuariibacter sp. P117]